MSATQTGDRPRRVRRKPTAMGDATTMEEKVGRLGALYEGLDAKVDAVDGMVSTVDGKVQALSEKVDEQYQDLKSIILAKQVENATRASVWKSVKSYAAFIITQIVIVAAALFGNNWFHGQK